MHGECASTPRGGDSKAGTTTTGSVVDDEVLVLP